MSIEERLAFATKVLELKTPLLSLKDLSDTRLNKLLGLKATFIYIFCKSNIKIKKLNYHIKRLFN